MERKHHPGMVAVTTIMILCTAFVIASAFWTFATHHMPFALQHVPNGLATYPAETGVMLCALGAVLVAADIYCLKMLYTPSERTRTICNYLCFAAWLIGLAVFMYGMSTQALTWLYFFGLTLPPIAGWLATAPKMLSVAGDQW